MTDPVCEALGLRDAFGIREKAVYVIGCSRCSTEDAFLPDDGRDGAEAKAREAGWSARQVPRADPYWSGLRVLCPQCADDLRETDET